MLLLAVDTATSAVTVALHDGEAVLARAAQVDSKRHGELVAPLVEQVMREAGRSTDELTHVVAGTGPGPFTGLRVGIVTARVLALTTGAQVLGVCTLDALANQAARENDLTQGARFTVATDARRKEVYWATYVVQAHGIERLTGPEVSRPADLDARVAQAPTAGRGPELYPETFPHGIGPLDLDAAALADLAVKALQAEVLFPGVLTDPEPLYLRRPDAVPAAQIKSVLA